MASLSVICIVLMVLCGKVQDVLGQDLCNPAYSSNPTSATIVVINVTLAGCALVNFTVCHQNITTFNVSQQCTSGTSNSIIITGLAPYQLYNFTATASYNTTNETLSNSTSLSVRTLEGVPCAPTALSTSNVTSISVVVSWADPSQSCTNGILIGYFVCYELENGGNSSDCTSVGNTTSFTIGKLLPYTAYKISVFGRTSAGNGTSANTTQRTAEAPPCAPTALNISNVTDTSVVVSWADPLQSCTNGILIGYFVCYEWVNGGNSSGCARVGNTSSYTTRQLSPYTVYKISVFGSTSAGNGTSANTTQRTAEAPPCPPSGLVTNTTNSSIVVSWSAPNCTNGILLGYFVCYESFEKNMAKVCFNESRNASNRTLSPLSPFANYSVSIFGYTAAGNGSAWMISIATLESTPCPPSGSVTAVTNSSIVVSWSAPNCTNGILLGYFVCYEPLDKNVAKVCFNESRNASSRTLSPLLPFANYSVSIFGYTAAGNGSAWMISNATLESTPCPPTGSVTAVTNSSIVVSWSAPNCTNGILLGYFVCYESLDKNVAKVCFNESRNASSRTLSPLLPFANYSVSVFAYTAAGNGSAWMSSNATLESTPCAPTALKTSSVTNTSITVSWMAPLQSCSNGILVGYFVCYQSADGWNSSDCASVGNMSSYTITQLLPFMLYKIAVFGRTSAGNGTSAEITQRTAESPPCAPTALSTSSVTNTSVFVSWAAPLQNCTNGILVGYFVCYESEQGGRSNGCSNVGNTTSYTIMPLLPYTVYKIAVFGRTSAGNGTSADIQQRTAEAPPCAPIGLNTSSVKSDSMLVSWSSPTCENGVSLGYYVCYEPEIVNAMRRCFGPTNFTTYTATPLQPNTFYNISVFGHTSAGNGTIAYGRERTAEAPPCAPLGLSTSSITKDSLIVSWTPSTCASGIVLGFYVCYQPENVSIAACIGPTNATTYKVTPLQPYTFYNLSVFGHTSAGNGSSAFKIERTAEAQPEQPPSSIQIPEVQPYEVLITWDSMKNKWGEILKYEISCTSAKTPCPQSVYVVNGTQTSLVITGLSRATSYTLRISGCTSAGCGNYAVQEFSTKEDVPLVAGLSVGFILFALLVIMIAVILLHRRKKWPFATPNSGDRPEFSMTGSRKARPIKLDSLPDRVADMHADSNLLFHDEYEELKSLSPKLSCDAASLQGNTAKNRYVDILPFDHSRVKLLPLADEEGSDYINANYMPGYSSRREFIAAQGPLPGTVDHFWRMIWEQNVSVVVMLTQLIEKGKRKCDQYWPEAINESLIYGDLTVTKIAETPQQPNTSSDYCVRTLRVSLNEYTRQVTLLCYLSWPDFGCPQTTDTLLNFVAVFRSYMALGAKGPAIVHCSAGVGRTGTFICLDHMLQQIRVKDEVDIFGTVLDMRNSRTRMVQTEDQYIYIHDCVKDALLRGMSPYYHPEKSSSLYANDDGSQYVNFDLKLRPTSRAFRNSSRASSSEGLVKD